MGLKALDGPAKGNHQMIRRAPRYLRFVVDRVSGEKDVLDQLDDEPRPNELVSVYIQESFEGYTHIDFDIEKGEFGNYVNATYSHIAGIDGQKLRETATWRAWADQRALSDSRRTRTKLTPYGVGYKTHSGQLGRRLPPPKRAGPNY